MTLSVSREEEITLSDREPSYSSKRSHSFDNNSEQGDSNKRKKMTTKNDDKYSNDDSINPDEGLSVSNNNQEIIELSSDDENDDSDIVEIEEHKHEQSGAEYSPGDDSEDEIDDDDDMDSRLKKFRFSPSPEDEQNGDGKHVKIYEQDPLPPLNKIKITKQVCDEARTFLKTEGHMKFLRLFVPDDPTSNDILILINLLGYTPKAVERMKTESDTDDEFMRTCIIYLQQAINRVIRTRTRLHNFYKLEHLYDALEKSKKILVLTGAGISTSLGIPDFRSSQGFYSKMAHLGLDDPQDVFSLDVFRRNPNVFYSIAHMILPPDAAFTPLHGFIKLLQDKGKLLRNYTQNIDNLEGNVGVTPDHLVQCHGSFATASCFTCKYKVHGDVIFPHLRRQQIAYCPFCTAERRLKRQQFEKLEDEGATSRKFEFIESYGVMKPDITFFGEDLPDRYHNFIKRDILECDLLLCIGTSLKVAPVSEIVNLLPEHVPQILINRDPIEHSEMEN
ncbi:unnamed protein product [Ambrosiozyma monospora]|uniref:Unnamed protein product n=1 Tax=Ambrosiozyma monospora TaxID=43982 RepID=A0ACB5TBY3_AMBMO|nr:unnamed protein product [Ambrosiozyma monospora]